MYSAANSLSGEAAATQMELASRQYLEAVRTYPFDPVLWDNLRGACAKIATSLATNESANAADRKETALRCALTSGWMAWILSDVPPGARDAGEPNMSRKRLQRLYEDRRSLAMHLRDDEKRVKEAHALAEQGVREAEEVAAQSPEATFLVADAYFGLAMMREEDRVDGWEPAFRAAIVHGEQWRAQQPARAEPRRWLGAVRAELANRLDAAKRPPTESAAERAQALRLCQEALRLTANDGERRNAQNCIEATHP